MRQTHIAVAALISATCFGPAFAQTQPSQPSKSPQAGQEQSQGQSGTTARNQAGQSGSQEFITRREANTWRASELMGKNVYGPNNEDIGEIGDVLLNKDGRVVGVIVDVGGFLGLGETHVAVPMHALQIQDTSSMSGSSMSGTGGSAGTQKDTTAGRMGAHGGPERIVLIITRAQLESAPKFKDDGQASGAGSGDSTQGRMKSPSDSQGKSQSR